MIGIRFRGGLGNQMFQYAFVINQALKTKQSYFLDKTGAPSDIYKYFVLKRTVFYFIDVLFFNYNGFKLFFSHYLRRGFYFLIHKFFIKHYVNSPKGTDSPHALDTTYCKGIYYDGFFQSPIYFGDSKHEILKYFEIKHEISMQYQHKYAFLKTQSNIVTIHVRKTDFLNLGNYNLGAVDLSLPFSYYHHIIKQIHRDDNYYVFISDSPELISNEFNYIKNKHISNDTEIVDFQHMLNADICIIANSTFSWWAAYLNPKKDKLVYCPQHYLGFRIGKEYPIGIYPADWIQVTVS